MMWQHNSNTWYPGTCDIWRDEKSSSEGMGIDGNYRLITLIHRGNGNLQLR